MIRRGWDGADSDSSCRATCCAVGKHRKARWVNQFSGQVCAWLPGDSFDNWTVGPRRGIRAPNAREVEAGVRNTSDRRGNRSSCDEHDGRDAPNKDREYGPYVQLWNPRSLMQLATKNPSCLFKILRGIDGYSTGWHFHHLDEFARLQQSEDFDVLNLLEG